jgi:hypothetical protein
MAVRFTATINTGNNKNDGESRRAECQNVIDTLERICTQLQNTQASGTVTDRNGLSHSYTYTPTAAA